MMTSSTLWGSSWGTLANTSRMTSAARSSGRQSTSDPLLARPMGVRPVATMTASGMGPPGYGAADAAWGDGTGRAGSDDDGQNLPEGNCGGSRPWATAGDADGQATRSAGGPVRADRRRRWRSQGQVCNVF